MSLADSVMAVAQRLTAVSQHSYQNPYTALEWPEAVYPDRDWFSTPEYLSLVGAPCEVSLLSYSWPRRDRVRCRCAEAF